MADIKINGNTYTGVTKLLAKKSDGSGEQAFVIPELESRSVNLGSSAPSSVITTPFSQRSPNVFPVKNVST